MKKTRFISLLLAIVMVLSLFCTTWANAEVLSDADTSEFEDIDAKAAILVDANTGTVLYELDSTEKEYPASTTKIMTCLLVLEAIEAGQLTLDQEIVADEDCRSDLSSDSSTQHIMPGEILTVEDLLYCLMVASANEAANILAVAVSGSTAAFVEQMNARATELGCTGTHFCNPHGLHDENHYTTAQDLYTITRAAWEYTTFRTIVGTVSYTVPATNLSDERHFYNTNLLLSEKKQVGYVYDYAVGVKTGTTTAAGSCLVSAAVYDGRTLIAVILGAQDTTDDDGDVVRTVYKESKRLLKHGFLDFQTLEVVSSSEMIAQVSVTNGKDTDYVVVSPAESITMDLVSGLTKDDFERTCDLPEQLEAPVTAGDVVGTMTISYDGTDYATVDLVTVSSVEVSSSQQLKNSVRDFFLLPVVQLILLAILVVLIAIVVLSVRRSQAKKRYTGRRRRK